MHRTRKLILVIAMLCLIMLTLSACKGKEFTCGLCGKTQTGKSHSITAMGQKTTVCDTCYKSWKEMNDEIEKSMGGS